MHHKYDVGSKDEFYIIDIAGFFLVENLVSSAKMLILSTIIGLTLQLGAVPALFSLPEQIGELLVPSAWPLSFPPRASFSES